MRLVCPNCGAQYEVDDRVIPEGGRDVQCSACGHGWYQMPQGQEHDLAAEEAAPDDILSAEEPDEPEEAFDEAPEDVEDEAREPASWTDGAPEEATVAAEDEDEDEDEESAGPPPIMDKPARALDEDVRSILQEEAQRELEARAGEVEHAPEPVETQPDLGLDDRRPSPEEERRRIARERMARMRGIDEDDLAEADFDSNLEPPESDGPSPNRRAQFPDIEEINSTLDSHAPRGAPMSDVPEAVTGRRSGFARGFSVVIFLAALLLAVYVLAPKLATSVPALEPMLSAYVEAVNTARAALEELLRGLIEKIEAAAVEG